MISNLMCPLPDEEMNVLPQYNIISDTNPIQCNIIFENQTRFGARCDIQSF